MSGAETDEAETLVDNPLFASWPDLRSHSLTSNRGLPLLAHLVAHLIKTHGLTLFARYDRCKSCAHEHEVMT